MDYEKCYVYQSLEGPPTKKRRVEPKGLHTSWSARRTHFEHAWKHLDGSITQALAAVNAAHTAEVHDFLLSAHKNHRTDGLPTGVVLLQPGSSSRANRANGASEFALPRTRIISLESTAAPNLKTALKSINHAAATDADQSWMLDVIDDEDDDEAPTSRSRPVKTRPGRRLLAYDLQILHKLVTETDSRSVIVYLQDTEGFDSDVLSDLILHLSYWRDRIPLVLLMNVSTSVDMLERRLSKAARSRLQSRIFAAASCEEEFDAVINTLTEDNIAPIIGPTLIRLTNDRQHDYLQDVACIRANLKYTLMTAYFANPLTIFLCQDIRRLNQSGKIDIPRDHFEALRSTGSFRKAIRGMLDAECIAEARKLLDDDASLLTFAHKHIKQSREQTQALFRVIHLVQHVQRQVLSTKETGIASLYVAGLYGQLHGSATLRNLFLAMRKASAASIVRVLDTTKLRLPDVGYQATMCMQLQQLKSLMPKDEPQQHTVNKVPTDHNVAQYIHTICRSMEAEIERHLINPKDLLFHEVFLHDLISPSREVFTPRPRQAVERALSTPHDYLDCDCCGNVEHELDASNVTQPAIAVLYSLYKESGNLINAHDAWQAFAAIMGEDEDESRTTALFQRGLAELKHLGMVKSTRKRVDHIAKVAWPGL